MAREEQDRVDFVWNRIVGGDRVRFFHDYYGGQWIELTPRFQFWRKARIRLSPQEMALVKSAIRASRQVDARRLPAAA